MKHIFLPLILVFALSGCMGAVQLPTNYAPPLPGQVVTIQPGTVMQGIKAALTGHPGTSIWACGKNVLVLWANEGQQTVSFFGVSTAGVEMDMAKMLKDGGNLVNARSVSDLTASLKASGWEKVAPNAAPPILAKIVGERLLSAPVLLLAIGTFDEDIETWLERFQPVEEPL